MSYPRLIEQMIEQFSKLPGVGRRSAERMAFWILNNPREESLKLAQGIMQLKDQLKFCRQCNHLTESELCLICSDTSRDDQTICVVEDPKDVLAIEKTGTYKGYYHVLLGSIAPAEGRGPEDLKIDQLMARIHLHPVTEVVIATDADSQGETTALYLTRELKKIPVRVSRIGVGIPVGSAVEYADLSTLSMSLASRRVLE